MFTANSMNCLNEALGLALPGNGTVLATHKARKELFMTAAKQIVAITKEHYINGNNDNWCFNNGWRNVDDCGQ